MVTISPSANSSTVHFLLYFCAIFPFALSSSCSNFLDNRVRITRRLLCAAASSSPVECLLCGQGMCNKEPACELFQVTSAIDSCVEVGGSITGSLVQFAGRFGC